MNCHAFRLLPLFAAVILLMPSDCLLAQSIGINFSTGRTGSAGTIGETTAGVVPQANWNEVTEATGTQLNLRDSEGARTSVSVEWEANNAWSISPGVENGGNNGLMNGYLDTTNVSETVVTLRNVPFARYDVIVYADGDGQGREGRYSVNGNQIDPLSDNSNWGFPGTFQKVPTEGGSGNYALWSDLAGSLITVRAKANNDGAGVRAPINAIQIVSAGPSNPPTIAHTGVQQVDAVSATVGVSVSEHGPAEVTVYYGVSDGGVAVNSWENEMSVGMLNGASSVSLLGLQSNQTYFYRAFASNAIGQSWAPVSGSFMTGGVELPQLALGSVNQVTGSRARVEVALLDDGNASPEVTLYYGSEDRGETVDGWDAQVQATRSGDRLVGALAGLMVSTDYVVRARVTSAAGDFWITGTLDFTTLDESEESVSVVINEIHYDPADATSRESFVELHNAGEETVDLAGWRFSQGIDFVFPQGTSLVAGAYLVVAEDPNTMRGTYGIDALGPWSGRLRKGGERLALRDSFDEIVDRVDYGAGFPWPTGSRGGGGSAELIYPGLDNDLGGSWRTSGTATAPTEPIIYVSAGSEWRYRKGNSEPPSTWRNRGFSEDASWLSGEASIGYADGDDTTTITDMRGNYSSLYFRKGFTVATEESMPSQLTLRVYVDDGAIVWINGTEIGRVSVSPGAKAFDDFAENHEATWEELSVPNPDSVLRVGANVVAVHAMNSTLNSSDFSFDLELRTPAPGEAGGVPTPRARNSVWSETAPPQVRQVNHFPESPSASTEVILSAKVTDPDGVGSVRAHYQIVEPGQYVRKTDAAFETGWQTLTMSDEDGDNVYETTIPSSVQRHRRLIRYRIEVEDSLGASVRLPYADDGQANFAYFVYNGAPAWRGAFRPGETAVQTFPEGLMDDLPTYHLIAREGDVIDSQYNSGSDGRHMLGTLVYDGVVYDHIDFENRGEASTYVSGKNKWRFHFNRARQFQARDAWGRKYASTWNKLSMDACASPWAAVNRGMAGIDEAVSYRLYELAGVPSSRTHHLHFRVIDDATEASGSDQYEGDLWGLYLAVEDPDGSFLDDRDLPDGNVYKIEGGRGDKKHQGPTQPTSTSDWDAFRNATNRQTESWWRENMDLATYYSYRSCDRISGNVDLRPGSNHYFYHHPDGRWVPLPWDLDMMYIAETHWPGVIDQEVCLQHPNIALEFRNRAREMMDLMCSDAATNGGQIGQLIDEYAQIVNPSGQALTWADLDAAMWNMHPRTRGNPNTHSGQTNHKGQFFYTPFGDSRFGGSWTRRLVSSDFEGFVDYLVKYTTDRFNGGNWAPGNGNPLGYGYEYLKLEARDTAIPSKPTITYIGGDGFPVNALRFRSSAFADPQGAVSFGAMEWRVAEIAAPGVGLYEAGTPRRYEIQASWESGILNQQVREIDVPTLAVRSGRTYRARVRFRDNSNRWSHWSDPVQFTATTPDLDLLGSQLRITEIMYHPAEPTAEEASQGYGRGDFEFVELRNVGESTLDLTDVRFTKGIDFDLPDGFMLAPGEYVMVVANEAAFAARYGTGSARGGELCAGQTEQRR